MNTFRQKTARWIPIIINTFLSLFFIIEAYFSLQWRMVHDSPILFYMGYLISQYGAMPFRDFFDMNMPGAHWFNALSGSILGFNDLGFQLANLLVLLITLALIFWWLHSFGIMTAWSGVVLFGIFFLQYGPAMSMQREFITLPFILAALLCFPLSKETGNPWRFLVSGLFVSLAVLVKPQSGLILVVLLLVNYLAIDHPDRAFRKGRFLNTTFWLAFGFSLPLCATLIYFSINQALGAFLETATQYWPLYNDINARLEITTGMNKFLTSLGGIQSIGINILWLAPALLGFFNVTSNRLTSYEDRQKTYLMAGGAFVSFLEVIVANKYWEYHWLPMIFFLILLSASGLISPPFQEKPQNAWPVIIGILLTVVFILRPSENFWMQINNVPLPPPQGGRVDEIADYLKENLQPGDTVQPLDWSNGAVQAMLVSRARPATRYLYDFHFYHHISNPEIQNLRKDFLYQLTQSKPRVVIQFFDGRPWVDGFDTARDFPELKQFLVENYLMDQEKNGYRLWLRK